MRCQSHEVGLCYDEHMNLFHPAPQFMAIAPKEFPETKSCPEVAQRTEVIYQLLVETGLINQVQILQVTPLEKKDLFHCHSEDLVSIIWDAGLCLFNEKSFGFLQDRQTFYSVNTKNAILYSAGSVATLVREALQGQIQNGFAICRPPGHHASLTESRGFCLVNNIALAAHVAIEEFSISKIAIIDWDVHHGNGTQDIFAERNDVLFISIHRQDKDTPYVDEPSGSPSNVGRLEGTGFTVNIELNEIGLGDAHYSIIFENLIKPILNQYEPELILVSAGFDSCRGDPFGKMDLTEIGYAYMTNQLQKYGKPLILALEGGYNLTELPKMVHSCIQTLVNKQGPSAFEIKNQFESEGKTISEQFIKNMNSVSCIQSSFWNLEKKMKILEEYEN